ncbi:MAG: hypothetical protein KKA81_07215 [Bacteroidetes bacterium]|nr:hypothetical protein [Bacteroidota bacterium]
MNDWKSRKPFYGVWIFIGIGIGALIGGYIKNFPLGIGLGLGLGIILALWTDRISRKRTDRNDNPPSGGI